MKITKVKKSKNKQNVKTIFSEKMKKKYLFLFPKSSKKSKKNPIQIPFFLHYGKPTFKNAKLILVIAES